MMNSSSNQQCRLRLSSKTFFVKFCTKPLAAALSLALVLPFAIPVPGFASNAVSRIEPTLGLTVRTSNWEIASALVRNISSTLALISSTVASDARSSDVPEFESRASKVSDIETFGLGEAPIKVGNSLNLTAVPVDNNGETVSGVKVTWKSSDPHVAAIEDDRLGGLMPGETTLTLSAGSISKSFRIKVEHNDEKATAVSPFQDDLQEQEYRSFFTPQENLGAPAGQVEAQASSSPVALRRALERPGSSNFGFSIPVASLPGRGSDAGIDITYNSRLWSLWRAPIGSLPPKYWYNRDNDWLAPGFKMTLGELRGLNYYNYSLTSPDGTKHQLHYVSGDNYARTYETADGTFIRLDITATNGVVDGIAHVHDSNGSRVEYTKLSSSSGYFYPTKMTDRNGNVVDVAYKDPTGRILYIRDTLNRYINFHYDSENKLVAVSVPGLNGGPARQTVRLYYETINFDQTTPRFSGTVADHYVPPSATVLRYVYFPGSSSGYEYEYSAAWGMIYRVSDLRGMQVSSSSLTETGSVTNEGEVASSTTYNYPLTLGAPLTEVPFYTTRTDDWLGRTTPQPPVTTFQVNKNTSANRTETRVTAPDGTITESWARMAEDAWDDGLITDVFLKTPVGQFPEKVWSHTKTFWGNQPSAPGRKNIRVEKVEMTNDAQQTRATTFEYDNYNNQTIVREFGFAAPGTLGAELRRTEMTYETGAGWITKRLVGLPTSTKTFVGSIIVARTDYQYDGESLTGYGPAPITQHDPNYGTNAIYRGNLTKVTSFADPTNSADPDRTTTMMKYDIVGNLIETGADCCKERTWVFDSSNHFTYPVLQKDGDEGQLETTFSYDPYTGVLLNSTDANLQTTTFTYDANTIRQTRVDLPNGAWSTTDFNDQTFPYYIKTTSSLDAARSVSNWVFHNGHRQSFRTRRQWDNGYLSSDVEFDSVGRPVKAFNPYSVSNLNDVRPGGVKYTSTTLFDGLGRALETKLPDDTTVLSEYDGLIATITDQAGKKRRQIVDALGRIVRVDEPNANGELGAVEAPHQPTFYVYDGNDNLTKTIQSDGTNTQERLFKYDGLSRLTHEKQVEANATLNTNGDYVGTNGMWTGFNKYNSDNLLEEAVDARGVRTTLTYDGLNRVSTITFTGENGYQTPGVTYTYDQTESGFYNKGRLTRLETALNATYGTPATVQNYRYDKVGQISKHTQSIGSESYLQEYSYNLAGQLISQKYPSGRVVQTAIDNLGRIDTVSDAQRTYLTDIAFDPSGIVSRIDFGNGTHETNSYNDRFQITAQSLMRGAEVLQKFDYSYGAVDLQSGTVNATKNNGQVAKIESYIGSNKQASQRFAYDHLGRLKETREHRGDNDSLTYRQVFDFDRFGNLYRKAEQNPTAGQSNPLPFTPIEDAHVSKATNRFTSGTTYNDAGQVVADAKFRAMGFAYDANRRQVRATAANRPDALTVYDGLGNRVATSVNGAWQLMVYDAFGKLVAEYGTAAESVGRGVKYLQQDRQGSVRAMTNGNGFVVARADHQAFGDGIGEGVGLRTAHQGFTSAVATRQGYALTENDAATGQRHSWWRKLETQAGRWTSPDAYNGSINLLEPGSLNRVTYVESDPVNRIDPTGLDYSFIGPIPWWLFEFPPSSPGAGGGGRPLFSSKQLNARSDGPAGGAGIPPVPENDDWKMCIAQVEKDFSKPPSVSEDEWRNYNVEKNDAAEAHQQALMYAGRQRNNSIYWAFIGAAGGAAVGGYFGNAPGAAVGAAVGGGVMLSKELNAYEINAEQATKAKQRADRKIRAKFPRAAARDAFNRLRNAAILECNRLAIPTWLRGTRTL